MSPLQEPGTFFRFYKTVTIWTQPSARTRATSVEAIEELVQCGICLDKMTDPRMLACQHTFCLSCLQTHLTIKSNSTRNSFIHCPLCQNEVVLERGLASLVDLPKNFYVDSLLSLITSETGGSRPTSTRDEDIKLICVVCAENNGNQSTCLHCKQVNRPTRLMIFRVIFVLG